MSSTAFSQLKIIHPNGGERLQAGSEALISWRDSVYADEMGRVEFSSNSGKEWTILHSYRPDYNYKWTVPNIISDSCLIKVTQTTDIQYTPPLVLSKSYGGNIYSMELTSDGGIIAVGEKDGDGYVIKIDPKGAIEWTKNYGNDDYNTFYRVTQTRDSGYIVAGRYNFDQHESYFDGLWVMKLDSLGNIVWERKTSNNINDIITKVMELENGNIVISTTEHQMLSSTNPKVRFQIIKPDQSYIETGNSYGGSCKDVITDFLETEEKGLIMAGYSCSNDGDVSGNNGLDDGWVMKVDSLGEIIWSNLYGSDENDRLNSISKTNDGGYIVAGSTVSWKVYEGGGDEYWILKLDKDGNVEWERRFGTKGDDVAIKAFETEDGNFIVAGYSDNKYRINGNNYGLKDYWLLKFNKKGWIVWASNYGGKGEDIPFSIIESGNGQYVMGGRSSSKSYDIDTTDWQGNFWVMKIEDNNFVQKIGVSDSVFSIVEPQTSLLYNETNIQFTIHPNVTSNTANVTLKLTESGVTSLELFDSQGRRLDALLTGYQTIGHKELQIDVSQYPSGRYFLKLITPTISRTEIIEVVR